MEEFMKFKKSMFPLLLIFLVFAICCSLNVLLDEQNSKLPNYNFKIGDLKNIDKTLSKQKYSYSTDVDKKYVAVITYQSKTASTNQYLVTKDGTVDLTVPKGSLLIVSLPANRTVAYAWNIKNSIDNGVIKLINRSWIDIPISESEKDKTGVSYDRQNFYFKPLKSGAEKIVMRYEHQTIQNDEFFELTFNVKIQQ